MMNLKYGLSTGLMIARFCLAFAVCLFFFGYQLISESTKEGRAVGLIMIILSFPSGLVASVVIVSCKSKINLIVDYGTPVLTAAEYIKEIVQQVNIYSVDSLKEIIEVTMKDELKKVVKKEKK